MNSGTDFAESDALTSGRNEKSKIVPREWRILIEKARRDGRSRGDRPGADQVKRLPAAFFALPGPQYGRRWQANPAVRRVPAAPHRSARRQRDSRWPSGKF